MHPWLWCAALLFYAVQCCSVLFSAVQCCAMVSHIKLNRYFVSMLMQAALGISRTADLLRGWAIAPSTLQCHVACSTAYKSTGVMVYHTQYYHTALHAAVSCCTWYHIRCTLDLIFAIFFHLALLLLRSYSYSYPHSLSHSYSYLTLFLILTLISLCS